MPLMGRPTLDLKPPAFAAVALRTAQPYPIQIVWALTLVVTIKYVIVLMRADNRGEGGILALTVLALRAVGTGRGR